MAKAKGKSKKIKKTQGDNFLLLHGEKFLFAIVVLLVGWLITRGSGLEPFDLTPAEIKEAANKAEDRIKKNELQLKEVDPGLVLYDYSEFSRLIKSVLKPGLYHTATRWDQSLFPDKIKRPDIIPLPAENLQATACVGAIRYRGTPDNEVKKYSRPGGLNAGMVSETGGPQGGGYTEGRYWIAVTGLIPVGKEFKQYDEKFRNAQYTDLNRDVPKYVFYELQRGHRGENGEISWESLDLQKVYDEEIDRWNGVGLDPVSPNHISPIFNDESPRLTMVCPPLLNKTFGEEASNVPAIPLLSDEQLEEQFSLLEDQDKTAKNENIKKNDFSRIRNTSIFDETAVKNMSAISRQSASVNTKKQPGTVVSKNMKDDYYLFRHFDFDVQEGITYYYRVKLYLANPNYGLDANLVENPSTLSQATVETDYSEPSNPVSLGKESRILAESLEPGTRPESEPKITLTSIYFNTEDAHESLVQDKRVVRGQVANFYKEQHKPIEMDGVPTISSSTNKNNRKNARVTVDHVSDVCVLDSSGGYKIPGGDLRSPAKLLLLEPSGLVELRRLQSDQKELQRYTGGNPQR